MKISFQIKSSQRSKTGIFVGYFMTLQWQIQRNLCPSFLSAPFSGIIHMFLFSINCPYIQCITVSVKHHYSCYLWNGNLERVLYTQWSPYVWLVFFVYIWKFSRLLCSTVWEGMIKHYCTSAKICLAHEAQTIQFSFSSLWVTTTYFWVRLTLVEGRDLMNINPYSSSN